MKRPSLLIAIALLSLVLGCSVGEEAGLRSDAAFIVRTIQENYPYLEIHRERDGFDWHAHVKKLIEQDRAGLGSLTSIEYLSRYIEGLNGHVHIIDAASFPYYYAGYHSALDEYPEYAPWAQTLGSDAVLRAYGYSKGNPPPLEMKPLAQVAPGEFTKKADTKLTYVKIPTFDMALVDTEGPAITDFLRRHSTPETIIIIDIRGNSGGSDQFWLKHIVGPLMNTPLIFNSYHLYKGGEASRPFIEAKKITLRKVDDIVSSWHGAPGGLGYYELHSETIQPTGDAIPYRKIVVLMDRANFSSSESFVHFCKSTGFATLVGSNSSGDGVGFDPILVELPFSHLILRLPIDAALGFDGAINYDHGTAPDIVVEDGMDSLQYVIDHIDGF
jgi:hypothetical protein